jgi:regulator of cell morphogenesis and NO signaling
MHGSVAAGRVLRRAENPERLREINAGAVRLRYDPGAQQRGSPPPQPFPMSTHPITAETTVGELVRAVPSRSRILERLGIDYCCGGKKPLAEACRGKGLDPATVVSMLNALDASEPAPATSNPEALTLSALCDEIQRVHHGYLREELPRLDFMTRKVAATHGGEEPRLLEIRELFLRFAVAMISHAEEEETQIFPEIRRLDSEDANARPTTSDLKTAFEKLESEHDEAGAALERFHVLTDGFNPPDWACNTFRALYDGLAKLVQETHQHVHKENNVLFPRALAITSL